MESSIRPYGILIKELNNNRDGDGGGYNDAVEEDDDGSNNDVKLMISLSNCRIHSSF